MLSLIYDKIVNGFFTLIGVVCMVFFLFNILGNPAQMMLDQNASEKQLKKINQKYGFDLPVYRQFLYYLNDLSPISIHSNSPKAFHYFSKTKYTGHAIKFNSFSLALKWPYLRTSYQKQGKKVSAIIYETLPNTILLATSSIGVAIFFGMILGVLSGYFKGSYLDSTLVLVSTLGMSLPSFFSAILFSWIFGHLLTDYTGLNMTGSLMELDDFGEEKRVQLKNLFLPALVLGIRPIAVIVQLVRTGIIDVLNEEYIKTAYAKGLSSFQVVYRHAIKNTMNPVITAVSGWFASMLAGAVFVEYIFGWRGLGKEIVNALNTLDIPVVMGAVLVISCLFVLINSMVDLLYMYVDPKAKPF